MIIILDNFPIPPSSNAIYRSFFNKKVGRLVHYKSQEMKAYEVLVESWSSTRQQMISSASETLTNLIFDQRNFIRVDAYFGLKPEKLWNREGSKKKMDVSNRIKALHDCLSNVLAIDDRFFYPGECEPVIVGPWEQECVIVKMTIKKPRSLKEAYARIFEEIKAVGSSSSQGA